MEIETCPSRLKMLVVQRICMPWRQKETHYGWRLAIGRYSSSLIMMKKVANSGLPKDLILTCGLGTRTVHAGHDFLLQMKRDKHMTLFDSIKDTGHSL